MKWWSLSISGQEKRCLATQTGLWRQRCCARPDSSEPAKLIYQVPGETQSFSKSNRRHHMHGDCLPKAGTMAWATIYGTARIMPRTPITGMHSLDKMNHRLRLRRPWLYTWKTQNTHSAVLVTLDWFPTKRCPHSTKLSLLGTEKPPTRQWWVPATCEVLTTVIPPRNSQAELQLGTLSGWILLPAKSHLFDDVPQPPVGTHQSHGTDDLGMQDTQRPVLHRKQYTCFSMLWWSDHERLSPFTSTASMKKTA